MCVEQGRRRSNTTFTYALIGIAIVAMHQQIIMPIDNRRRRVCGGRPRWARRAYTFYTRPTCIIGKPSIRNTIIYPLPSAAPGNTRKYNVRASSSSAAAARARHRPALGTPIERLSAAYRRTARDVPPAAAAADTRGYWRRVASDDTLTHTHADSDQSVCGGGGGRGGSVVRAAHDDAFFPPPHPASSTPPPPQLPTTTNTSAAADTMHGDQVNAVRACVCAAAPPPPRRRPLIDIGSGRRAQRVSDRSTHVPIFPRVRTAHHTPFYRSKLLLDVYFIATIYRPIYYLLLLLSLLFVSRALQSWSLSRRPPTPPPAHVIR